MQFSNLNNVAYLFEGDVVNLSGSDDTGLQSNGMKILSGSGSQGHKAGVGYVCSSNSYPSTASFWEYCAAFNNYSSIGLQLQSYDRTSGADILIFPPDDTSTRTELQGLNAAGSA